MDQLVHIVLYHIPPVIPLEGETNTKNKTGESMSDEEENLFDELAADAAASAAVTWPEKIYAFESPPEFYRSNHQDLVYTQL